jgi:maleamate amidohydrolase
MDLEQDYAKAGFHGRLAFGAKPALVIVDVVEAYLDPASPLYAGPMAHAALQQNIRLKAAARKAGAPVVMTGVEFAPGGADGGVFYRKVPALKLFERGSKYGRFPAGLKPSKNDIVVIKQYASAFFGTSLASTLHAMGVDTVMLTGYSTSGCVRASGLDALQHGFIPFVIKDACADRAPGPHEANLFDLQAKYAEVVTTEEALAFLSGAGRNRKREKARP